MEQIIYVRLDGVYKFCSIREWNLAVHNNTLNGCKIYCTLPTVERAQNFVNAANAYR